MSIEELAKLSGEERTLYYTIEGWIDDPLDYVTSIRSSLDKEAVANDLENLKQKVSREAFPALAYVRRELHSFAFPIFCGEQYEETAAEVSILSPEELSHFMMGLSVIGHYSRTYGSSINYTEGGKILRKIGYKRVVPYLEILRISRSEKHRSDLSNVREDFLKLPRSTLRKFLDMYAQLSEERQEHLWEFIPKPPSHHNRDEEERLRYWEFFMPKFSKSTDENSLAGYDQQLHSVVGTFSDPNAEELAQRPEVAEKYYSIPKGLRTMWYDLAIHSRVSNAFMGLTDSQLEKLSKLDFYRKRRASQNMFLESFCATLEEGTLDDWLDHLLETIEDEYIGGNKYRIERTN